MRINSISIKNYRQYRDLVIEFNKKMEHDLHVVIGQNGMGKTNLLNAISWCLYDDEPHLSDKNKALPMVNIDMMSEIQQGESVKIEIKINISTDNINYEISREAICKKTGDKESVILPSTPVLTISNYYEEGAKIYQNDEASNRINSLFPQKNSEFYFFDGERLNKYFTDNAGDKIYSSIFELSQVGLLQTIYDRLKLIIKDMTAKASSSNTDLEIYKREIERIEKVIEELDNEIVSLNKDVQKAQNVINECNEFLIGMPNVEDLEKRRALLKEKEKISLDNCSTTNKRYLDFIRESLQSINMLESIHYANNEIQQKESAGLLPPQVDINLLKESLQEGACGICGSKLEQENIKKINDILNRLSVTTEVSHILIGMRDTLSQRVIEANEYLNNRDLIIKERLKSRIDLDAITEEIKAIDNELTQYQNREMIRLKALERTQNEALLRANMIEIGKRRERLEESLKERETFKSKYSSAEKKDNTLQQIRKERIFAQQTLENVNKIKQQIMNDIRENLRKSTESIFLDLIWKKNTYNKITIDESYNVGLMHVDGYNNIGGCSAAEKAFLALSFTIALHQVASIDAPLVIDTPLSRVSDTNRTNFAYTLRELSKEKQMILLFTPSEYTNEVSQTFESIASTKRHIKTTNERVSMMKEY